MSSLHPKSPFHIWFCLVVILSFKKLILNLESLCKFICPKGSPPTAGSVRVSTLLQIALCCSSKSLLEEWQCPETHKVGNSGHASLEVAQKLNKLRRVKKIISAAFEGAKHKYEIIRWC